MSNFLIMLPDKEPPAPDLDRVYRNHLATCQRLGIEPVPWDRTLALMHEWGEALPDRPGPGH